MGAIEDLAAALTGPKLKAEIDAENPYLNLAKVPEALPSLIAQTVAKAPGQYSTGEAIGGGLLSGLLGGALTGVGDDYTSTLMGRYQQAALAAETGATPDVGFLPPSLLSEARNAGSIFTIRQAEENKQLDINAKRALGNEIAIATNPDVRQAKVDDAIAEAVGKAKATNGGARANANNIKITKDLSGTIAAIAALNDNDRKINDLEGGDSWMGGAQRSAESLIPNTKIYNYIKQLPFLADPLTVGLSGTSKMGTLNKTLEALHPGFGQDKQSLLDASNSARQVMIDKASKYLDVLKQSGYPVGDLQDYQDKLDAAASGTLVDDSYLPKAKSDAAEPATDPAAAARAILKSRGIAGY